MLSFDKGISLFKDLFNYFMCMYMNLSVCICTICIQTSLEALEDGVRSSGARVRVVEPKSGPLQRVRLLTAEPQQGILCVLNLIIQS